MLKLKMYPAKNGDAFLVDAAGAYILIDAGYKSTFTDHIVSDLTHLSRVGHRLNLAVSTHIDVDHIGGMLEFFQSNGTSGERKIIDVDEVWHNSLRSLPSSAYSPETKQDISLLQAIQRRGFPSESELLLNPIGVKQASTLSKLLRESGYVWNSGDGTQCISNASPIRDLPNGVHIRILGPTITRLERLREWWKKEMRRLGYRGGAQANDLTDDAYEIWCATALQPSQPVVTPISARYVHKLEETYEPDTSIPNGCSIAFIVYLNEWRVLFLGDAWAEDIVTELRRINPQSDKFLCDAIKISHHGSLHNTSVELLSLIDAPCYFISSDASRYDHPDFEVLAEIVDRPSDFERKLYFNYETSASNSIRKHTSRSGAKFSVHIVGHDWITVVGEDK